MPARTTQRLLALAFVAGFALTACTVRDSSTEATTTPPSSPPTPIEGGTLYTNGEAGFEVSYPRGWEPEEGVLGAVVSFRSPQEGARDRFRDNVTILTQSVPPGSTLDQYTSASLDQLEGTVQRYELVSEEEGFLGANEGRTLVYEAEYKGTPLRLRATYVLRDETVYLVTYTAARDTFDRYEKDADVVFGSFTLL